MANLFVTLGVRTKEFEDGLARAEKTFKGFTKDINAIGGSIDAGISQPLRNLGRMAIDAANEVRNAFNDLALGTGATGEALQGLKDDFRAVAAQVPSSMSESAKAVADLNTMLGMSGAGVQELAVKFLDLSRITKSDLSSNISSVTKLINNWGLSALQGSEILDKLLFTSQQTGTSVADLARNLADSGGTFRAYGFSLEESAAMLGLLNKNGIEVSKVLTGLDRALGNLAESGVKDLGSEFRSLLDEIKNAPDTTTALQLAAELFGKISDVPMASALRSGGFEFAELAAQINNANGTLQNFTQEAETFADGWGRIKNQLTLALEPLGEHILRIAQEYLPALSDATGQLAIDFSDTTIKIGMFAAAGAPVILVLGSITASIQTLLGALGSLIALLTGPAGIVVGMTAAGIATAKLIDYFDPAVKRVDDAREAFSKLSIEIRGMTMEQLRSQLIATEGTMRNLALQTHKTREAIASLSAQRAKAVEDNYIYAAFGGEAPFTSKFDDAISEKSKNLNTLKEITAIKQKEVDAIKAQIKSLESQPVIPQPNSGKTIVSRIKKDKPVGRRASGSTRSSGRSEAELFAQNVSDRIKYYNEDGAQFLDKLKDIQDKLKPLSDDWKRLEDLRISINDTDFSKKIQRIQDEIKYLDKNGVDFLPELEALAEPLDVLSDKGKRLADLIKNIKDTSYAKEWSNLAWEYSEGILKASDYAALLSEEIARLTQGTDEWKAKFSELQNVQSVAVSEVLDSLSQELQNGTLSNEAYENALESIKNEFSELPKVVNIATEALKNFHEQSNGAYLSTQQQLSAALKNTTKDFNELEGKGILGVIDGLTNACVYNENFGDSLKKLGQEIIAATLKMLIMKAVMSAMSGIFGGGSGGAEISDGGLSSIIGGISGGAIGSAKGNVFKFSRGGLVNRPTLFPMKDGLGLMGEVPGKSEAVMPLTRDNQGRLGVYAQSTGQNPPTIIINLDNESSQPVTASQGAMTFDEQFNRAVIQVILRDQATNGPISRNYRR